MQQPGARNPDSVIPVPGERPFVLGWNQTQPVRVLRAGRDISRRRQTIFTFDDRGCVLPFSSQKLPDENRCSLPPRVVWRVLFPGVIVKVHVTEQRFENPGRQPLRLACPTSRVNFESPMIARSSGVRRLKKFMLPIFSNENFNRELACSSGEFGKRFPQTPGQPASRSFSHAK